MESYKAIFRTDIRSVFEDYIDSLNIPQIDYFAIAIQDPINLRSASMMSRLEWQKTFKAMNFAEYDPIRTAVLNTNRSVFYFDEVDHLNTLGNEIMLQRKKHEMRNGIVLVDRQGTNNYMMTLATDYRAFEGKDFLLKHRAELARIFKDLSLILQPIASDYILK